MGQIQWMLSLIPDAMLNWLYWLIIAVGISGIAAGWLGRWIPFYGNYVRFLKPIGVVVLVLGVWLRGGYDTEMAWRAKVEEAQAKVALAETASKEFNAKLDQERKKKAKVRTERMSGATAPSRSTCGPSRLQARRGRWDARKFPA